MALSTKESGTEERCMDTESSDMQTLTYVLHVIKFKKNKPNMMNKERTLIICNLMKKHMKENGKTTSQTVKEN